MLCGTLRLLREPFLHSYSLISQNDVGLSNDGSIFYLYDQPFKTGVLKYYPRKAMSKVVSIKDLPTAAIWFVSISKL